MEIAHGWTDDGWAGEAARQHNVSAAALGGGAGHNIDQASWDQIKHEVNSVFSQPGDRQYRAYDLTKCEFTTLSTGDLDQSFGFRTMFWPASSFDATTDANGWGDVVVRYDRASARRTSRTAVRWIGELPAMKPLSPNSVLIDRKPNGGGALPWFVLQVGECRASRESVLMVGTTQSTLWQ